MAIDRPSRAAQFLPFDSVKGLHEELRLREEKRTRVEKKELTEETEAALSAALFAVRKGDTVQVTFYYGGHYVTLTEKVVQKSEALRFITVGSAKIRFDDIYELKIVASGLETYNP